MGSIRTLKRFLKAHPDLRRPSVVLPPNGCVKGIWRDPGAAYVEVEFLPRGALSVVYAVGTAKGLVPTSIEEFRSLVEFLGFFGVMKSA